MLYGNMVDFSFIVSLYVSDLVAICSYEYSGALDAFTSAFLEHSMHLRVPVAAPVCILVSHFRNLPLMDSRQHAATHTDGSGLGTSNYSRPASATPATNRFSDFAIAFRNGFESSNF